MSTTILEHRSDLIPLAPARRQRSASGETATSDLFSWRRLRAGWMLLRQCLPKITSHRQALLNLADGYDRMARRCIRRGDQIGAKFYRESAKVIREQNNLA